jgi:hypothetical protein
MLALFGVFSSPFFYPQKKKERKEGSKCGFSTGGVSCGAAWNRLQKKKKKNTFWGFLGTCYQNFNFFLFRLYLRSGSSILGSSLPFPGMNARVLLEIDFGAGGRGFYR